MLWEKDRLRATQPYFVFDTYDFSQEVYLQQGISHFYTYKKAKDIPLRTVPDGCIDIVFEFKDGKIEAYVCGTPLKYSVEEQNGKNEVFGIRFLPGVQPSLINVTMKDLLTKKIPLIDVLNGESGWINRLEDESDFYQKIRIFIGTYTKIANSVQKPFGKKELVWSVKKMVYDSDGKIKVSQMQENTGYSERYINKAFIEKMGFPPKTFCKIIQFQRSLEFLNYGAPDRMTDAAVFLGYYDQSQFIRDFVKYAGITPKNYLKLVEINGYKNRIKELEHL